MKIGDKVPFPAGQVFNLDLVKFANSRRGSTEKIAKRKGRNQSVAVARKTIVALAARDHRLRDPFEQARLFLGRMGIPVYSWAVYHDDFGEKNARRLIEASPWVVGAQTVSTRIDVMTIAREHGWPGPIDLTTSEGQIA